MNTTIQVRMLVTTTTAALLMALLAPGAEAHHRPTGYCSESGDLCQSVRKHDGVRKARITLAARYFRAYVLCVSSPLGYTACERFRIQSLDGSLYGDSVRLRRHFTIHRAGSYTVSWYRVPRYGPPSELIGESWPSIPIKCRREVSTYEHMFDIVSGGTRWPAIELRRFQVGWKVAYIVHGDE